MLSSDSAKLYRRHNLTCTGYQPAFSVSRILTKHTVASRPAPARANVMQTPSERRASVGFAGKLPGRAPAEEGANLRHSSHLRAISVLRRAGGERCSRKHHGRLLGAIHRVRPVERRPAAPDSGQRRLEPGRIHAADLRDRAGRRSLRRRLKRRLKRRLARDGERRHHRGRQL